MARRVSKPIRKERPLSVWKLAKDTALQRARSPEHKTLTTVPETEGQVRAPP